ncbi:MAG: cytochrome D ubiquinol oxidase subunit I [Rhodospirillales bacterium]|jgi:glutamate/tyrosine decarboxylase-like PLP-dependent enzyme|nr:cytochrome D ubiquinol oxidase subunit I [Rhodospirillales bacterium]
MPDYLETSFPPALPGTDAALEDTDLSGADLDPAEWESFRATAHRALDGILDHLAGIRDQPVWQPTPPPVRAALRAGLSEQGEGVAAVLDQFDRLIRPFATGNTHPRFMGWVHGGGNVAGLLGEMLAAGLNANLGGRDHAPILVERQVIAWMAALLGLPEQTGGLLVTGTSIANLIGVLIARAAVAGKAVRQRGVHGLRLAAYTSAAAHGCISRAMDMAGLGTDALRLIPTDAAGRMDLPALNATIARDRADGVRPFLLVGTAGTVDIGAIDDLAALAAVARREAMWFHVDGAFGALAAFAPDLRPLLAGIEAADSVAFDFHKWGQVPYDAGCILVRDAQRAEQAFAAPAAYLRREARGLAGGAPWPCDLGPDLSRGFRALKVWFTLKTYGSARLGRAIAHTCALARALAARVDAEPELERLAPVALNIVCFRYRFERDSDARNAALVADLQEAGIAAPSTTLLDGRLAIRAALVNHRTRAEDVATVVDAVLAFGRRRAAGAAG